MKKLVILSVIFFGYSCSPTLFISPKTINLPLYSKSNNAKELIRSKYGVPSKIENQVKQEIWIYNYSSSKKSNRTVIFDNNGKIIKNKKHYKRFHMITGLNRYSYIVIGVVVAVVLILPPFPALL
ncbi:hypothetical protein N8387_02035 [Polaribacter sp.]|nr:hypothetical protein [Polaribacter sp.]MDC1464445.1 hypothetical protein [Polaribacter sp.]